MKSYTRIYLLIFFVLLGFGLQSQNQASKWCFGNQAGLDFMTNPPSIITQSMNVNEGCASISDAAGNLLFYTNGSTVWNSLHQTMAGGTGLMGLTYIAQNSLIVKQPGNANIYFIFNPSWNSGFYYSVVDMSLAAGLGSVTATNVQLAAGSAVNGNYVYFDKVSATKHCNGTDVWVLTKETDYNNINWNNANNNFYAYLVTSAGVNTTAVISAANTWTTNWGYTDGTMKISPNGTKVGLTSSYNGNNVLNQSYSEFELWDFNSGTGAVTNSLALSMGNWNNNLNGWSWGYGCEFSPDGTKFYGSSPYWNNVNNTGVGIAQWDLCAGSPTAVAASLYTVATQNQINNVNNWYYFLQLAPNGKVYVARYGQTFLDVINNPNAVGAACNYVPLAQSIGTRTCYAGLPNFMTSYFSTLPPPPPFTYTVNTTTSCLTTSFTAPNNPTFACSAMGYSVNGISWDFGDPNSGAANTSTISNPVHTYPVPGTYTTVLTFLNACGSNSIALPVVINGASLTITTASITCASLGSATVTAQGGTGPFSYTWMPTAQTNSIATGLIPGNYSITVVDNGGNCAYTSTVNFASLVPFTGLLDNSASIPCNGVGSGTAAITLAGGSGNNNYFWNIGSSVITTPSVNSLPAGLHTVTVIDALTSCSVTQNFFINQPPAMNLNIVASSPTTCAGTSITFTATNSGGTPGPLPGYTYTWTNGPGTNTRTVSQAAAGNYSYYASSRDVNNCNITNTIVVTFVPNPTLAVSNVSICPLQVGTLIPTGAASYTYLPSGLSGPSFTASPLVTTGYTITGATAGCTATPVTSSIVLKPIPSPTITSNSPVCNGQALVMSSSNGSAYLWVGPLVFSSSIKSPTINPAAPGNSGVYSLTLTAANNCTASTTTTLTVHPTPTVAVNSNTVCVTQTINLTANSFVGASYFWQGPLSYTSNAQNPSISNATVAMTGAYNLTVTSLQGCTNTAVANASVVALPIPVITPNTPSLCLGANLTLSASGGISYNWSGPNGFANASQNTGINNVTLLAGGIYSLLVTTGPCTATTTQSITVFPLPSPSASSVPTCDTKNLVLTSNGGGGIYYSWTGPLSFASSLQNPTITAASPLNSGLYTLLVTDVNNCQASTSTQVSILLNPIVKASGITVCIGNSAVLTASGAVSYLWSGPGNYSSNSSIASIPVANSVQPQVYTVMGTAPNSCTSVATAVLNTIPLPTPSLIVNPSKACVNSTVSLQGFGGDFYEWRGPYNLFSKSQTVSFTAVNLAYGGTYTLTAFSNAGCSSSTTGLLQIDAAPDGDLVNSSGNSCVPFCSDFSLVNKSPSPVVNTVWQINGREFNTPVFNYCFNQPGDYVVMGSFTNAIGCVNSSSFQVTGYPLPVADFEFFPENPVAGVDEVQFTNTSQGAQLSHYNWFFMNNRGPKVIGPNAAYTFENNGIYPVALVVRNIWGCADSVVKAIKVEPDFNVYVPNAFTPNDDGTNDVFLPKGTGIVKYDMVIYDRWGQKLFQTSDFTKGWDGTFKGEECKSDVYVWKAQVTDLTGKTKNLDGFVTLYR